MYYKLIIFIIPSPNFIRNEHKIYGLILIYDLYFFLNSPFRSIRWLSKDAEFWYLSRDGKGKQAQLSDV